jgi:hypothetical protein
LALETPEDLGRSKGQLSAAILQAIFLHYEKPENPDVKQFMGK